MIRSEEACMTSSPCQLQHPPEQQSLGYYIYFSLRHVFQNLLKTEQTPAIDALPSSSASNEMNNDVRCCYLNSWRYHSGPGRASLTSQVTALQRGAHLARRSCFDSIKLC